MTASKQKGTGGETELLRLLATRGIFVVRKPASAPYDLDRPGTEENDDLTVKVLATRPNRGQWLFTVDLHTFAILINALDFAANVMGGVAPLQIEVKRWRSFPQHTLWRKEMTW